MADQSYPSTAFVLTLIGGIFILLGGIYEAVLALIGAAIFSFIPGFSAILVALAVVALLFGLIILLGALMLRSKPQSAKTWGVLIIVFSVISLVGGGGFVIGFILALIGGILAMTWKPPMATQPAWGSPPSAPAMAGQNPPTWGNPPPGAPPSG